MMTLRLIPCLLLTVMCASCSNSSGPVSDSRRNKNVMSAPNSPLSGSLMTPSAQNHSIQRTRLQNEALSYRRAANQATGDEREQYLQMAESLDRQAAALNAQ